MTDPVFFAASRRISVLEIANVTGATLMDPTHASVTVSCIAPAAEGGEGALVYVEGKRNAGLLPGLRAAAVLCTPDLGGMVPSGVAGLTIAKPQQAFARIGRLLFPAAGRPQPFSGEKSVSSHAYVDPSARIEEGAIVEPMAFVGPHAAIGRGTVVASGASIGPSCRIGRNCFVGPSTTIQCTLIGDEVIIHAGARIGQDGFGYVAGPAGLEKIPQIGRVVIQDRVEIGANTTIDRGTMSDTVIGEGTKIDNQVQIAHNVRIGRNCVIAAHCGISGSVNVGDGVKMAGRVGIADHLTIGSGAQLGAGSGFMDDVPAGEAWVGYPARPLMETMRGISILRKLASSKGKRSNG